jgi:chromosome segregation ATPase
MKTRSRREKSKRRRAASPSKARGPKRRTAAPSTTRRKRARSQDRPAIAELEREIRRLRAARSHLERRLTAAVQEIGTLRQFELRAQALEAELASVRGEHDGRLGGAMIVSAPSNE